MALNTKGLFLFYKLFGVRLDSLIGNLLSPGSEPFFLTPFLFKEEVR